MAKGKKMKVHGISKSTVRGCKDAKKSTPKLGSYRREGFGSKKTNHPGMGGANVAGITGGPSGKKR